MAMKNSLENKERRKKKRKMKYLFQGILITAGVLLVALICIGEIRSLFVNQANKQKKQVVYEKNSEREKQDSESGMTDRRNVEAEQQTVRKESETESETENETETAEESDEEKLAKVLANRSSYPEKILGMLDKNMETLDFVYHYPEKKGNPCAYFLKEEDLETGGIPLLIQWDERWGYGKYGENVVGTNGCGPACMAMVIAGLTGNIRVTPYTMAIYSEKNGYLTSDGSTMWSFIANGGEEFGVQGQAISLNEETVIETLKQGFPIICSVGPGDFTDSGHFLVLTGYIDGKIKINDPYSYANSEKLWEFEVLQPQIKNLWKMQAIESENYLGANIHASTPKVSCGWLFGSLLAGIKIYSAKI